MYGFVLCGMLTVLFVVLLLFFSIIKNIIVIIFSLIIGTIARILDLIINGKHRTNYDFDSNDNYYNLKRKGFGRRTYAENKSFKIRQMKSNYPYSDSYLLAKYMNHYDDLSPEELEKLEDKIIESNNKNKSLFK